MLACVSWSSLRFVLFVAAAVALSGCANDASESEAPPRTTTPGSNTTPSGNSGTTTPPAGPVVQPARSAVVLWNEAMLSAIRNSGPKPTIVTRQMFIVHAAIYDAWALYDATAVPVVLQGTRKPAAQRTSANKREAVSQAAYHTLVNLFPEYESNTQAFSNLLAALGYAIVTTPGMTTPSGVGLSAAQAVLADRDNDGSNAANNYVDVVSERYDRLYTPRNSANPASTSVPGGTTFDPARWQPLRVPTGAVVDANGEPIVVNNNEASYSDQTFLTPHWGAVRPFAITRLDELRPSGPPLPGVTDPYTDALGKITTHQAAYDEQVKEILDISASLGDREKVIAEYWADGPRSETPPGHWNALAHGISDRDAHDLDDDVKMYFALNCALLDAAIAVWEAKREYDYIRPVSAIRHKYAGQQVAAWGGPNRGTATIDGLFWRPYQQATFVTPGFPEFVSGHSGFSAASAEVLTRFTGSKTFYDGVTMTQDDYNKDGVPDLLGEYIAIKGSLMFEDGPKTVIKLTWHTFQDAADEAGVSRRYGGIHIQDGDLRGRALGRKIGEAAFAKASAYWSGTPPAP
jgi:hypothetical protein